ncbi:CIC11C00000005179 [Sungouiella intermedia]|uniref:Aminopeptidase n=1 Tax=Sungouiella intermedia TaxID=45354 RepID=A0A1L0DA72_9ASCO|nr:CIC11C00000005179 [[Candida] intermedia]
MCPLKPYYEALPSALKPTHYDISISNISDENYSGVVNIDLDVVESTNQLHLHYRDLTIGAVTATYGGKSVKGKVALLNKEKEYFVVEFADKFEVSHGLVSVKVAFDGNIQTNMAGFYKSSYKEDGETKYMLSTQFEATDARRTFPCLDEPALKATFAVNLTVENHLTVLGNMPVKEEKADGDLKVVTFETTPIMSTYLLAWAVGEFEYIEGFTSDLYADNKPLPVRIYTTKGYTKDAELALSLAPKIVDYFSKIFELKYPLPKLDLIAVHSFSHNAMENWGLITYRSTALLYSEETSDPSYKQNVAYVVAHEIAHQWFGNLVTMQWWDELWLNEGFATWVGYAAVDFLFPEWDIFSGFVSTSLQNALGLDGLRNSHPIKVPVVDALDIDQLFDAISYLKGASTIRMLSSYLHTDVFLKGVAKYLNNHKFGNATSDDLWSAISDVSGKNIGAMMESWITKIGFPVIKVTPHDKKWVVEQSRFLNGGGVKPEENETVWWVPLDVSSEASIELDSFSTRSHTIDEIPTGLFKLNKETEGVFRVSYDPKILHKNILPYFGSLSGKDKVGIIADVLSISVSGDISTSNFLDLVKSITIDDDQLGENYVAWLELCNRLAYFSTTFSVKHTELSKKIAKFTSDVYRKLATKMVSQPVDKDDFLKSKLRAKILNSSAGLDIPEVKEYAEKLFNEWKTTKSIDPSLRYFAFSSIVSSENLTGADFDLIMSEVTNPTSLDSREIALGALGHISNEKFAEKLISYLGDETVIPVMDAHFLGISLSKNTSTRDLLWSFFKQNYSVLHKLMSSNMVVLDRFIKVTLCNYQSFKMEEDVKQFFEKKDIHGFERSLSQVLDQITINASYYQRDQGVVQQWLTENGY